jgi:hypothetical protein
VRENKKRERERERERDRERERETELQNLYQREFVLSSVLKGYRGGKS